MAFIRRKVSRGRAAFYLVENHREGGKVRQRVLAYLGPCDTLEGAIAHWEGEAAMLRKSSTRAAESSREMWSRVHPGLIRNNGGEVPFRKPQQGGQRTWGYQQCRWYWEAIEAQERYMRLAEAAERKVSLLRSLL
jgi:hypothetical protein